MSLKIVYLVGARASFVAWALAACVGCSSPPATSEAPLVNLGGGPPGSASSVGSGSPSEPSTGSAAIGGSASTGAGELTPPPPLQPPRASSDTSGAGGAPLGSAPVADAATPTPEDPAPAVPPPTTFPMSAGIPTVYLAGDSTVQTYGAAQAPQQGWGQRIAEFFTSDATFVNKAIGGRSSKSFIDEGRLDEIVALLEPGDYLFAQWGINDRYRSDPVRFTDPSTTFKQYLKMYIDAARSRDAIPVLVTPTPRLDFSNGAFQNGFAEYCTAIKEVGAETDTRVIDLQNKGLAYYTNIGLAEVEATIILDVLHFKAAGAREMARLVAEGVKESDLPINQFVR